MDGVAVGAVLAGVLFLMLASIEQRPQMARSMRTYALTTLVFWLGCLGLQTAGLELPLAFASTFVVCAVAIVGLFAAQRVRHSS